ncbi:FecR domain-containing protein [Sphingomonas sp. OK281]|uniref:FecR family protein n=1 Tax=Sphingomonas sp. OK281 TaxID=1881067 RepID=UPI0008E31691|nr:FecR domain-containing protein [Sphingomonas sp. OK281]SFN71896.1 FecR family protein [Sphingomonas sp. OK281]
MSGHTDIPQRHADLTDEAAGWLAALDAGSADVAAFEAWRNADIRHAVAFAEVAGTWRDLDGLRGARRESGHSPETQPVPKAAARPNRRQILRATGSIVGVAAVGGGIAYRAAARDMAETRVGQRITVAVTPGISLDLNTDSRVYWRTGAPARLWLDRGEIAVRLAADHRLQLLTPGGQFGLDPGAYNVRLRGAGCELAVLAGGISDGATTRIGSGEVALVTAGQVSIQARDDIGGVTAWQHDTLVLNGESLDYAVAEMNRYLPNKIVIGDPALSRVRVGGSFATTRPAEFLRALRSSFGIRATAGPSGGIVLTRA